MILRACLFSLGLLAAPVVAGQYTHDAIIGFSEDGRYFAFKTYGLQRGSGLPHATVYVVDLMQNAWVPGSPFSAGRDEMDMAAVEAAPYVALDEVRRQARDAAGPMLQDLAIYRPATVLYAAGIGQAHLADEMTRVAIPNPDDPTAQPMGEVVLRLAGVTVPAGVDYCADPDALRGYRLELLHSNGTVQVLHEDQRIPASRGCAEAYRIDAVLSAGYPQEGTPLVALISVWKQGFEGLERHVIAAPVPMGANPQRTQTLAIPGRDIDLVIADFLGRAEPLDIDALDAALPVRKLADPSVLRWPDADLPPVARAVELVAAQTGFAPHGRIQISEEIVDFTPDGAGGPMQVSLIRIQAFNLGEARRNDLIDIFGADTVAPIEDFGSGPSIEWRFVMRPVQGMRADVVAASRREIPANDGSNCGPVPCGSPDPVDMESLGQTCANLPTSSATGATTRLGQALHTLADDGQATQWLIEHGLWQDDAMQIIAGQAMSCWWTTDRPD